MKKGIKNNYSEVIENYIFQEIFDEKIYDFEAKDEAKTIIIDCGANVGFSIAFFKTKLPNSTIYAFEPDETMYDMLMNNIYQNRFSNVKVEKKAVGNLSQLTNFYTLGAEAMGVPVMSIYPNELANKQTEVESVCFGSFVKQFSKVDFCKIDIEGSESLVIKSLVEQHSLSNICEMVVEYHHWIKQEFTFQEMKEILEQNNFEVDIIKEEPKRDNWSISGNTIFRAINNVTQCQ